MRVLTPTAFNTFTFHVLRFTMSFNGLRTLVYRLGVGGTRWLVVEILLLPRQKINERIEFGVGDITKPEGIQRSTH